jgi:transcriptional regulator with XRE-family HTH domain
MQKPQPTTYTVNGAQIRKLRMGAGLKTRDLAAKAGIDRSYLTQLELGWRKRMRPPTYTALRAALGLQPNDEQLLEPTEHPRQEGK